MKSKTTPLFAMFLAGCLIAGLVSLGCDGSSLLDQSKSTKAGDELTVNYPGAGTGGAGDALQPGVSPRNACECSARVGESRFPRSESDVLEHSLDCFYAEESTIPAAAIEQLVEILPDGTGIHIRLTLDPRFVDNTYGQNSIGWQDSKNGIHQFKDLVGSDHAEMKLFDGAGQLVLHYKIDYLSEMEIDAEHPAGYGTLGVKGGDGEMIKGPESAIIGVATSMDRNLNGCGFGAYLEDSPLTDETYSPTPGAPEWDYRVVYELWVDAAPFGAAGFGDAKVESVHASPSKMGENTIVVLEGECPDDDGGGEDSCNPKYEDCDTDKDWTEGPI